MGCHFLQGPPGPRKEPRLLQADALPGGPPRASPLHAHLVLLYVLLVLPSTRDIIIYTNGDHNDISETLLLGFICKYVTIFKKF